MNFFNKTMLVVSLALTFISAPYKINAAQDVKADKEAEELINKLFHTNQALQDKKDKTLLNEYLGLIKAGEKFQNPSYQNMIAIAKNRLSIEIPLLKDLKKEIKAAGLEDNIEKVGGFESWILKDINQPLDQWGNNALMFAAHRNKINLAKLLLDIGASKDIKQNPKTNNGYSAYDFANLMYKFDGDGSAMAQNKPAAKTNDSYAEIVKLLS